MKHTAETALLDEMDGCELWRRAEGLREPRVALRRQIHARPEYGFREHEAARLIADMVVGLGAHVREGYRRLIRS